MLGIGIDFGHGETAAAIFGRGEETAPVALELCGEKSIPSVMSVEADGRVLIGNAALRSSASGVFCLGWKRRPSQMTAEERENTCRFMSAVWRELSEKYSQFLKPELLSVYLATPNDWWNGEDRSEAEAYLQIARNAGIPNVHIEHESKATMAWATHENKNFLTPQTMQRGIMVLDAGSSTLDFTYLREGASGMQNSDRGFELGAALLDKLVLKQAVERSDKRDLLTTYFQENPVEYRKCELEARFVKERYFRDGVSEMDCRVGRFRGEKLRLEAELDFDRILGTGPDPDSAEKIALGVTLNSGERSWAGHLEQILGKIASQWQIVPGQLGCIIKTGGASRMPFIDDLLKKTFGPAVDILCDPEPDLCVAKGLAFIANAGGTEDDGEPAPGPSMAEDVHETDDLVEFRFVFRGQGWTLIGANVMVVLDDGYIGSLSILGDTMFIRRISAGEHTLQLRAGMIYGEHRHTFRIPAGRKKFTLTATWARGLSTVPTFSDDDGSSDSGTAGAEKPSFRGELVDFQFRFFGQTWGLIGANLDVLLDNRSIGKMNVLGNSNFVVQVPAGGHALQLRSWWYHQLYCFRIPDGKKKFTLIGTWKMLNQTTEFTSE